MPPAFFLEYFDPPPDLERHILVLFHFKWDAEAITDKQPGALGQLTLMPEGAGKARFGKRTDTVRDEGLMLSGFSAATPIEVQGPWSAFGASLSPLGWAALTQEPANQCVDRLIPPTEILGDSFLDFATPLNRRYREAAIDGREAAFELASWIGERLNPVSGPHETLIEQTITWLGSSLNPEIDELFENLAYSRRQSERLIERYFGFPPAALARKYRAIRAADILSQPTVSDSEATEVAEAFYDQPHMVRELRRFCGRTPARLGGTEEPLLQTMLKMRNFDRLQRFRNAKTPYR